MRPIIATALALVILLFLGPMLLVRQEPLVLSTRPTADVATAEPSPTPIVWKADAKTTVRVKQKDGTVSALSMADYLWRVVAAEMPAAFELEALKAQAVTARTYSLFKISGGEQNHPDADLCTEISCCQAYLEPADGAKNWGVSAEKYTKRIADAVGATDGEAILYEGAPIDAVFFSSTAGRTVDAVSVWGNAVPYLSSVESPEGEEVPNYRTEVSYSVEEVKTVIQEKYPKADLSGTASTWFGAITPTASGSVSTIVVGGVPIRGTAIRTLFSLRSASFSVMVVGDQVTFSVTGYGHGVGMSQYGANAMAKEGKDYREILTWYYSGVTIEVAES